MSARVSLRDVAAKAGVSHTTVSLSLRNDPRILPATRRKIARLAETMGYQRNAILGDLMGYLRTLKTHPTHTTLGFITAWPTRAGWSQAANHRRFHAGARARASELGYALDEFWLNEPAMTPARMTGILLARGIKGLILHSLPESGGRLDLRWQHFAAVTKGLTVASPLVHRVVSSHYDDMQLVLGKLKQKGYRRLGLVLGKAHDIRVGRAWLASYSLYENEVAPANRIPALLYPKPATAIFARWLHAHRPEVVIFADSFVPQWITELGLKAPRDIGLVHLDWSPEHAPLTGIDSDPEALGTAAIELLVGQLHAHEYGVPRREKVVEVRGRWVAGGTL
ncbi:MAG: LacI family DNA-binding transcriptional regulator [Lacunisphaera sp.]